MAEVQSVIQYVDSSLSSMDSDLSKHSIETFLINVACSFSVDCGLWERSQKIKQEFNLAWLKTVR